MTIILPRKKAETARWLAHSNLWGNLATTSVHLDGRAWAQPKSFVDGSEAISTGIPYFYDRLPLSISLTSFCVLCFTALEYSFIDNLQ